MADCTRVVLDSSSGFVAAVLVTWCLGCSAPSSEPIAGQPEPTAPNVIVVIADSMRADRSSLYGHPRATTPYLAEMARDGIVFERAFSPAPWTPPSMASLMTGLYQTSHGVTHSKRHDGRHSVLDDRALTLAEALAAVGYRTGAVTSQPWISEATGFAQGFDDFEIVGNLRDRYATDKVITGGLEWIDRHRDERFFLYLHAMDPHYPYEVPDVFRMPDARRGEAVPESLRGEISIATLESFNRPAAPPNAEELAHLFELYDAEIRYVDWWLGVLDRHLRHRGLRDNTLIIVTSDHGEAFWEHGVWGHITTVYNEMLHIPLVLSMPGLVDTPRRESRPVHLVDIMPTLAKLIGFELPTPLPGHDLLAEELPGIAYSEGEALDAYKIQTAELSLILDADGARLYDLTVDPTEQHDIASERPDDTARLLRLLRDRRSDAASAALTTSPTSIAVDEETRRELEALGYAN